MYEILSYVYNELNSASVIVVEKSEKRAPVSTEELFVDLLTKDTLKKCSGEGYWSEKTLCIYPIVSEIPCITSDNAIIASKYVDCVNQLN